MIIIENFLPYPEVVRTWALQQNFYSAKQMSEMTGYTNTWPGKRTVQVNDLSRGYADTVLSRVASLGQNFFGVIQNLEIKSSFQLCVEGDGDSWIHVDNDVRVAGLLYLTPGAPIDSGTNLYTEPPHEISDTVGNVFNRLVLYDATKFHKSSKYFGSNLQDGRLTQVFFIKGN